MDTRNTIISFFILSLACLGNQNSLAGTVYQWTDEAGNVNYSDVPPHESVATKEHEISFDSYDDKNIDLEQYSIINQVEKMAEWRRQLKEERLAEKMLHLEEKRLAYEIEQQEINNRNEAIAAGEYGSRSYYYVPHQSLHHRGHRILKHPGQIHQQPIGTPSRRNRNIIPRKYGPVHF